jgi:hypothetical protein
MPRSDRQLAILASSPRSRQIVRLLLVCPLGVMGGLDGRQLAGPVQRDGAQPLVRPGPGGGQRRINRPAGDGNRAANHPERCQRAHQRQGLGRIPPGVGMPRSQAPFQASTKVVPFVL